MTPADQEFIHDPENGQYGDCQRAVIATLLDLSITAVPHFLQEAAGDAVTYWEKLQAFVRSHGFVYLTMPARAGQAFFGDDSDVFHEISGPSPRGNGVFHAVVGCNGQIVFDPHPSRAGLAGDPATWQHSYLVRINAVGPRELGLLQAENAGLEAANLHLSRMVDELRELVDEVTGCFDAAHSEGLSEALAETTDGRLKDLVERRLLHALYACQQFKGPAPADDSPNTGEVILRDQSQRYEITSIKYLAGELTLRAVDDAEVPQELESGQVVTFK